MKKEHPRHILKRIVGKCPFCYQSSLLLIGIHPAAPPLLIEEQEGDGFRVKRLADGPARIEFQKGVIGVQKLIVFDGQIVVCTNPRCSRAVVEFITPADVQVGRWRQVGLMLNSNYKGHRTIDRRTYFIKEEDIENIR